MDESSTHSNIITQASTGENGGADSDNRCARAYTDRGPVREAGPALSVSVREADGDGRCPGVQGTASPDYLDLYDNVSSWLALTCDKKGVGWFIAGECENGHRFAKELVCSKEWCSVCGKKDSVAHNRRFMRWLPKVCQMAKVGYFVFTLPESERAQYRTKKALAALGHRVQGLLKSYGYTRGLRRWHWFGDKSTKWNPHLNILVDGGFVSPGQLDKVRAAYARLLGVQVVDVNYHYRRSPGQMVHTLKYVTRATFSEFEWDIEMALELRGFRNMVVWGRGLWSGEPAWSLDALQGEARAEVEGLDIQAIESLAAGVCAACGKPLVWGEALPMGLLSLVEKTPLGAGYYRLTDIPPPRELPRLVKLKLYWLEVIHRAEVRAATERAERERAADAALQADYQAVLWRELGVRRPADPPVSRRGEGSLVPWLA